MKNIIEIINLITYIGCYISIIIFTIFYWKNSIYKAACGGNGILQQKEMVKLAAAYAFCGYCVENIYGSTEFDWQFGSFLLLTLGFTMNQIKEMKNPFKKDKENNN